MAEILTHPMIAEGIKFFLTGLGILCGGVGIGAALFLWMWGMSKA